ncbi:ectin-like [Branchiostoma floridae x Branchiostoma belcheri]
MESQTCFVESCPVDGEWTPWSLWTTCDVTCGGGTRFRYRSCSNPPPKNNGEYCMGSSGEMEYCNETPCPEVWPSGWLLDWSTPSSPHGCVPSTFR